MGCASDRVPATRADFAPVEDAESMIGKAVHVDGMWRGCRWTIERVEDGRAWLRAKKSNRVLNVAVGRLLSTRRNTPTPPAGKGE